MNALLFDLDETLMVEEPAAVAAFEATARHAADSHDLDAARLVLAARARARELWRSAPTHEYCRRVGISSWEGLWCRYEGHEPETRQLREWSSTYRRDAWMLALAEQGIEDRDLAEGLGERFGVERRARHHVFPDAHAAIRELSATHVLGLVTNGASCLQREKLLASGLSDYFEVVVVSAEVGVAKPHPSVFKHALAKLGAGADTVMVGDSIEKDIAGALAVGLRAIWVNRHGRARPDGTVDVLEVATLDELPAVLHDLG